MLLIGDRIIDLVLIIVFTMVFAGICYLAMLAVLSRRDPDGHRVPLARLADPGYDIIFLIPCLNEALVLDASLRRLLALPHPRIRILVVDDGSDDGTSDIVRGVGDPRVHLLQRALPHAQQGKGEALNAGLQHIRTGGAGAISDPATTIVVVMDADGRLEERSLHAALPIFDEPTMGGVQVGVRISNRHDSLLAQMQDFEFVFNTEVYQRGRRRLRTVGLGGNGQFVRLTALADLGERPWSRSLTEDLDLGVRLLIEGWQLEFCKDTAVHQQGLVSLRRWIRQRTRWFQGHLQSWRLIPQVLTSLTGRQRADLLYHLTSPFLQLVATPLILSFVLWAPQLIVEAMAGELELGWIWISVYCLMFGPVIMLGIMYRRAETERPIGMLKALALVHVYVGYALLWQLAGWRALFMLARGRTSWAKTERLADAEGEGDEAPAADDREERLV